MGNSNTYQFYYKTTSSKLTVSPGTLQSEIIDTLRVLFKIKPEKKLLFLDGNGTPIVLSSALPNKTKLTIVEDNYTFLGLSSHKSMTWVWKKKQGIEFINQKQFKTLPEGKTTIYGNIKMQGTGKYWWKVQIQQIHCCQQLGITENSLAQDFWRSKPQKYNETIGFPDKFPGQSTGPGDTGCYSLGWKNHIFNCCLDFKSKSFIIVNQTLKRTIQDAKLTFDSAVPYFHSNKHQNSIKLLETGYQK